MMGFGTAAVLGSIVDSAAADCGVDRWTLLLWAGAFLTSEVVAVGNAPPAGRLVLLVAGAALDDKFEDDFNAARW